MNDLPEAAGASRAPGQSRMRQDAVHKGAKQRWALAKQPVPPDFLVGRRVKVLWDQPHGWFEGSVVSYSPDTLQHTVEYDDGDEEELDVGLNVPVKVCVAAGESLPPPSSAQLTEVAARLLQRAAGLDDEAQAAAGPSARRQLEMRAGKVRRLAQDLLELGDIMAATEGGAGGGAGGSAGGSAGGGNGGGDDGTGADGAAGEAPAMPSPARHKPPARLSRAPPSTPAASAAPAAPAARAPPPPPGAAGAEDKPAAPAQGAPAAAAPPAAMPAPAGDQEEEEEDGMGRTEEEKRQLRQQQAKERTRELQEQQRQKRENQRQKEREKWQRRKQRMLLQQQPQQQEQQQQQQDQEQQQQQQQDQEQQQQQQQQQAQQAEKAQDRQQQDQAQQQQQQQEQQRKQQQKQQQRKQQQQQQQQPPSQAARVATPAGAAARPLPQPARALLVPLAQPAAAAEAPAQGALSEALVAARQLLADGAVHVANVPGLGFTSVEWPWQQVGPALTVAQAQAQMEGRDGAQQQPQAAAQGGIAAADLPALEQELESALAEHEASRQHHQRIFKEMDVSLRVSPAALVGYALRVYWPLDDAWFLGSVEAWDPRTGRHKVSYEDGSSSELLWMGAHRVRLFISPGEPLPRPSADELAHLARCYAEQGGRMQRERECRGADLDDLDDDELALPGLLQRHAQVLLGASHLRATRQVPEVWAPPSWAVARAAIKQQHAPKRSRPPAKGVGSRLSLQGAAEAPAEEGEAACASAGGGAKAAGGAAAQQQQQHHHHQHQLVPSPAAASELAAGKRSAADCSSAGMPAADTPARSPAPKRPRAESGASADATPGGAGGGADAAGGDSHATPAPQHAGRFPDGGPSVALSASGSGAGGVLRELQQQQQQQQPPSDSKAQRTPSGDALQMGLAQRLEQQQDGASPMPAPSSGAPAPAAGALAGSCTGSPAAEAQGAPSSLVASIEVGEALWAMSKNLPPWPVLVISTEEATDYSVPPGNRRTPQVSVQWFGLYERGRVSMSTLLPSRAALEQRVWLQGVLPRKLTQRQRDLYRLALREWATYCRTGELPNPEMVPEHNDERWLDNEEPTAAAIGAAAAAGKGGRARAGPGAGGGKRKRSAGAAGGAAGGSGGLDPQALREWAAALVAGAEGAAAGGAKLPLLLGSNLEVLSLGRVEFLHPAFHTEKFIWPVGFRVRRLARTPASGGRDLWHVAEVLESPDGSGPLFRVTPKGAPPVTGSSPNAAWQELYKAAPGSVATSAASAARAASACGAKLFGLQHPVVQALVQALPNAAACERFMAWLGEPPPPVQLTPEQLLARRAIGARLLSLPPGVAPQPMRPMVNACDACGDELETDDNLLVECDRCRVMVHLRCYGVASHPDGAAWLCDVCRLPGLPAPPPCSLCPRLGGAMKVTAEGGWCHVLCATWIPGIAVGDQATMEPIIGTSRVGKDRRSLRCGVCGQQYGACIQCSASSKCFAAFHPSCAREAGYPMAAVWDQSSDDDEEEEQQQRQQQEEEEDKEEGRAPAGEQRAKAGGRKRRSGSGRRRPKKARKEGIAVGDNTRLLCFCPRHRQAAAPLQHSLIHQASVGAAASAGAAGGAGAGASSGAGSAGTGGGGGGGGHQEVTSPRRAAGAQGACGDAAAGHLPAAGGQQAAGGVMLFGSAADAAGTCARSRPADTAVRRGLRAPDALAAALRKRLYVRALPYLVTGCTRAGALLPPPRPRGRTAGPEFAEPPSAAGGEQQQEQQLLQADQRQQQDQGAGLPLQQQQQQQQHEQQHEQPRSQQRDQQRDQQQQLLLQPKPLAKAAALVAGGAAPLLPPSLGGAGQAGVLSLAGRFARMKDTVPQRICSGKSAIHGLGVFAKLPHRAGDLVVEYMGHLVRPAVADMLEAKTYNQMVGAGTYIFRLNGDLNVDATRAGNIAHLINHSCAPCCTSRTITVRSEATGTREDHVVIVAARDIAEGEELTYDYRFAGDEKLRCNCGAQSCRGWVNAPSRLDSPSRGADGSILLPRRELVPVRQARPAAAAAAAPPRQALVFD